MKIIGLRPKTAVATAVYYLAILALVILLGVIVVKLVIWPPCSITVRNECVVDGWSVAGLAGAVLGVGATVLAILGAVSVAYWWANLNEKVDQRVDEQVDQALKEQEKKMSEQTTHLLKGQEQKFEEAFLQMQQKMDTLEGRLQSTKKDLIIAITQLDPWVIEQWASEIMFLDPSSEVGVRMVRKYLQIVDGFFPSDPHDLSAVVKHKESLKNRSAPYQTPLGYWEHALDWQKKINSNSQLIPGQAMAAQVAEKEIAERRANIDSWRKKLRGRPSL